MREKDGDWCGAIGKPKVKQRVDRSPAFYLGDSIHTLAKSAVATRQEKRKLSTVECDVSESEAMSEGKDEAIQKDVHEYSPDRQMYAQYLRQVRLYK